LTNFDADLILLATHDIITGQVNPNLAYPRFFDGKLVKKSFLFLRMLAHIKDGIQNIGFEKLEKKIYFDGVYLHTLALKSHRILEARFKEISNLRIYAK
jgi:hypothetical protein